MQLLAAAAPNPAIYQLQHFIAPNYPLNTRISEPLQAAESHYKAVSAFNISLLLSEATSCPHPTAVQAAS